MRTHPLAQSRRRRRVALAMTLAAAALAGCLRNPSADAATAEMLAEIGNQLGALNQDNAELQNQVDSLRSVIARQDTVVRRLANLAGVPMPP
jgi:uncharacterized caspase-like protein